MFAKFKLDSEKHPASEIDKYKACLVAVNKSTYLLDMTEVIPGKIFYVN